MQKYALLSPHVTLVNNNTYMMQVSDSLKAKQKEIVSSKGKCFHVRSIFWWIRMFSTFFNSYIKILCLFSSFFNLLIRERQRERSAAPLTDALIGCFLYVSQPGIGPETLVYQTTLQPTELPSQGFFFFFSLDSTR